jgi:hypothetical protein
MTISSAPSVIGTGTHVSLTFSSISSTYYRGGAGYGHWCRGNLTSSPPVENLSWWQSRGGVLTALPDFQLSSLGQKRAPSPCWAALKANYSSPELVSMIVELNYFSTKIGAFDLGKRGL